MDTNSKIITGGQDGVNTISGVTTANPDENINEEVIQTIKNRFKQFLEDDSYIEACENYTLFHNSFIYQLYSVYPFDEDEEGSLINPFSTSGTFKKAKRFTFSIAKVLKTSEEFNETIGGDISPGDIVTLRDYDTATIVNTNYEVYKSSQELNKSNAENTKGSPDKYVNNIGRKVRSVFYPNKLDVRSQHRDEYIFTGTTADVITKVDKPKELLNGFK